MPAAPTIEDIVGVRGVVADRLGVTPLHRHRGLCELVGTEVRVKHEEHHALGAFKMRGGTVVAATLDRAGCPGGLVTASTGNHGQAVAFAGSTAQVPVTVAVPRGANPSKIAAMRGLGADVIEQGADFDEAREWAADHAAQVQARFVGPTDAEMVMGAGTYVLELLEQEPGLDVIVVPVGSGSGAMAACLVGAAVAPDVEVIAVQAKAAPAAHTAWRTGRDDVVGMCETAAEGVATRVPFANAQAVLRDPDHGLADFVLVSDDAMRAAAVAYLEHAHTLTELAGAAPLAAACVLRDRLAGRTVALVCTGANATLQQTAALLR